MCKFNIFNIYCELQNKGYRNYSVTKLDSGVKIIVYKDRKRNEIIIKKRGLNYVIDVTNLEMTEYNLDLIYDILKYLN